MADQNRDIRIVTFINDVSNLKLSDVAQFAIDANGNGRYSRHIAINDDAVVIWEGDPNATDQELSELVSQELAKELAHLVNQAIADEAPNDKTGDNEIIVAALYTQWLALFAGNVTQEEAGADVKQVAELYVRLGGDPTKLRPL